MFGFPISPISANTARNICRFVQYQQFRKYFLILFVGRSHYIFNYIYTEMGLVEGTHFSRRSEQPSPTPTRSKETVDYLFCMARSEIEGRDKGLRLDKLLGHYKRKHKDAFSNEGRSLLDMGFTVASRGAKGHTAPAMPVVTPL